MRYEIISEQIKKSEKVNLSDILKINAVYPKITSSGEGDKFAAAFNDMYEKAAKGFVKFAETKIKKTAEAQYTLFDTENGERFIPFGAVFMAKVTSQTDEKIHIHIDVSAHPGRSKRIVHVLDKREIKFIKPKAYL